MMMNNCMPWKTYKPNPNSKTQQRKKEEMSKRAIQIVSCYKCKNHQTTLYKHEKGYICGECKRKEVKKNGNRESK